ncbi:MAG: GntR family transcriptional regulator [Chloroflexota bacterium]|nr:GntR family transcriptional regulator [Chloroflexota bacterium]
MPLRREAPDPLYVQVKKSLLDEIRSGQYHPHDRLPSERELSNRFDVSRMTVRQALLDMGRDGTIYARVGQGTFVAEPRIEQKLSRLTGFTEDMTRRGSTSGARVLRLESIHPPSSVMRALQTTPERPVVLLERIRLAGLEPIAIETAYLHLVNVESLLQEDFKNRSLYQLLRESYDVTPTRAEQRIGADLCSQRDQALLKVDRGSPVLRNRRVTYDQRDRAFEYVESAYRADRYVFLVELAA